MSTNRRDATRLAVALLALILLAACEERQHPQVICEQVSQNEVRCGHKGGVLP